MPDGKSYGEGPAQGSLVGKQGITEMEASLYAR